MTSGYRPPTLLRSHHVVDRFSCQSLAQTEWLHQYATHATAMGTAKVLVVTLGDDPAVVAYYAWCMAAISYNAAPDRLIKSAGRYPQPVALLSRLGVDNDHQGHGLGAGLLQDVIARTAAMSVEIGCWGLLMHAESQSARDFYLHLVPEFEHSPTDDLHLVLLLKDIQRARR